MRIYGLQFRESHQEIPDGIMRIVYAKIIYVLYLLNEQKHMTFLIN